jgi:MFS family permease
MLSADNVALAFAINIPLTTINSMWIGAGASTVQDLVLPRMRAVVSAFYLLVITLIGFALGPYSVGRLSDNLGSLPEALRWSLLACGLAAAFMVLAIRHLERDEATLRERARAAGEALPSDL